MVRAEEARQGLVRLVNNVLDRLAEEGLPKTRVAEEWTAVAKADHDEQEFCSVVARLGLDPCSVDDQTAADMIAIASRLPDELVGDFFDTADASALIEAAEWTRRATAIAERASSRARSSLQLLYDAVATHELLAPAEGIRQSLDVMGKHDDVALEAVARYFHVSALLVRYQYDNQIARALS